MKTPSIIDTPAACIKCGFITNSPTTGKTHDICSCCGGQLITVSKLTPNENVIVLAKRASWECSNDDGVWYGRKVTEEQIIKHFAPIGAELATLRAKLATAEQEVERLMHDKLAEQSIANSLALQIGEIPAGAHPDEAKPRGATWHEERANWKAEVERLRTAHAALTAQHKRAVELLRDSERTLMACLQCFLTTGTRQDGSWNVNFNLLRDAEHKYVRPMVDRIRAHLAANKETT